MSGVGEAPKSSEQGGVIGSIKEAGANAVKAVQQKAGGSQVYTAMHHSKQHAV